MALLFARFRLASPGALGCSAAIALAGSVVLARVDPNAAFLTGILFGLAIGLALFAFAAWQRRVLGR